MSVSIGDIWQVQLSGRWHSQKTLTTFQYRVDTVTGTPAEPAFSTEIDTALNVAGKLYAKFLAACPAQYELYETWVQKLSPTRYAKTAYVKAVPGTYAQASNVPNTAGVITRKGPFAKRNNIGGIHVPLANLDPQIANGLMGANLIVAYVNLAVEMKALITLATLGGLTPVLWHGPTAGDFDTITTTQVQATTRVMRRRTVGLGE